MDGFLKQIHLNVKLEEHDIVITKLEQFAWFGEIFVVSTKMLHCISPWNQLIVAYWCHMVTQIWVNIGSGNGLLPDGSKPLPEPMLTYHQ